MEQTGTTSRANHSLISSSEDLKVVVAGTKDHKMLPILFGISLVQLLLDRSYFYFFFVFHSIVVLVVVSFGLCKYNCN